MNNILMDKEAYAFQYCEDNETLKNVLLKLWNDDIWTIGCCKGHDKLKAYVGIDLKHNSKKII